MNIKCEMFATDIQLIYKHSDKFKKWFPGFEMISKKYVPDDEFTEWSCEPEDMYEVEFNFQSMNHFWTMAKMIGSIIYKNETPL